MDYFVCLLVLCTAGSAIVCHDNSSTSSTPSLAINAIYPRTNRDEQAMKLPELQLEGSSSGRRNSGEKHRSSDQLLPAPKTKRVNRSTRSARPTDLSSSQASPFGATERPSRQPPAPPQMPITAIPSTRKALSSTETDVSVKDSAPSKSTSVRKSSRKSSSRKSSSVKSLSPTQGESQRSSGALDAKRTVRKGTVAKLIASLEISKSRQRDSPPVSRSQSLPSGDDPEMVGAAIIPTPVQSVRASTRHQGVDVGAAEVQSSRLVDTDMTTPKPAISRTKSSRSQSDNEGARSRSTRRTSSKALSSQTSSTSRDSASVKEVRRKRQSITDIVTLVPELPQRVRSQSNLEQMRLRNTRDHITASERQPTPEVVSDRSSTPSPTSIPVRSAIATPQAQSSPRGVPLSRWSDKHPDNVEAQKRKARSSDSSLGSERTADSESPGSLARRRRFHVPPQRPMVSYMSKNSEYMATSSDSSVVAGRPPS